MSNVYKVALNACRNIADAEDIVQNTYEKLWKCNREFTDTEHIKKWLIRVTINECNSLFRTPWMKRRTSEKELDKISFSTPEKSDLYYALGVKISHYFKIFFINPTPFSNCQTTFLTDNFIHHGTISIYQT